MGIRIVKRPSAIHIHNLFRPSTNKEEAVCNKQNASVSEEEAHTWRWIRAVIVWAWRRWLVEGVLSLPRRCFRRDWIVLRRVSFVSAVDFFQLPLELGNHQLHVIIARLKGKHCQHALDRDFLNCYASQSLHPTLHFVLWGCTHVVSPVVLTMKHKLEAILLRVLVSWQFDGAWNKERW